MSQCRVYGGDSQCVARLKVYSARGDQRRSSIFTSARIPESLRQPLVEHRPRKCAGVAHPNGSAKHFGCLLKTSGTERLELLTFVVVGGGPTGVELAGALGELSRYTLTRDFRRIDPSRTRVLLIEGGPRVLPAFVEALSHDAARSLEKLGVTVWTDSRVTEVDADGVWVGEERVKAATVLWAAGVKANPLNQCLGPKLDRAGRVPVEPDLSVPGHPEIFVVGDQARIVGPDGAEVPGIAPAALQTGRTAAKNILHDLREEKREAFEYRDKGLMATIGRADAVVQSGKLKTSGFFAWLAWCFVHIFYLIGFRNRLLVFVQWVWSYVRYRRGARLITERSWRLDSAAESDPVEAPVEKTQPEEHRV